MISGVHEKDQKARNFRLKKKGIPRAKTETQGKVRDLIELRGQIQRRGKVSSLSDK